MTVRLTDEQQLIEDTGMLFDQSIGKTPGRIIGLLMISEPPYMSMTEITEELDMAKSTISVSLRTLVLSGFVEKFSLPGERQDYYRIDHHFLKKGLSVKSRTMEEFIEKLDRALDILKNRGNKYPEHVKSLEEMTAFYKWFEKRLPEIFSEWEDEWNRRQESK